jgi:hypothetical protein
MKIIVSLPLFMVFFVCCRQAAVKVVEAEFNVDKTRLSDSAFVSKTGFKIYPPLNWRKTESYNAELEKKIMYRIDNRLLSVYKSDSTDCALIISELPEPNFDVIRGLLKSNSFSIMDSTWTSVQSSVFRYKTYEIIQIVYQNSGLIIFKLFAHRLTELYELDYIIPRDEIKSKMQSVESSIGSIN